MSFLRLSETLDVYLILAVLLFCCGLFGFIRHRSLVGMLISAELILAGASLNFMAFERFRVAESVAGQSFVLFIMGIAAAEAAIVLSIMIAVYRNFRSVEPADLKEMEG